jgi:hydroxyethylthiazole kinase-like uncharacterized protein yjeF
MKAVTRDRMRQLDRSAIVDHGIPGEVLMERAGRGVAEVVLEQARLAGINNPAVLLVAGTGNNGGDVFVAARHLAARGVRRIEVCVAGPPDRVRDDALAHLRKMTMDGIALHAVDGEAGWRSLLPPDARFDIVVDGVLGTGIHGPSRSPAKEAIACINALSATAMVVAVDIPSGLDADSGEAPGETVVADITATMALPKIGLLQAQALAHVGAVTVIDIGLPDALVADVESRIEMVCAADIAPLFRRRARDAHKGRFGHVFMAGGSDGFSGAIALAAGAAVRSGAGLVSALVPECLATAVAAATPEAMVHRGKETCTGSLAAEAWAGWQIRAEQADAMLVGPGMTTHPETRTLVEYALRSGTCPVVLDADALNVLQASEGIPSSPDRPVVITPHPGELARFLGQDTAAIQADRIAACVNTAEKTGATVVLKGAGTVIARAGNVAHINLTGNPGMATGGTGDVLAGLLAGLLAQGLPPFGAACAAAFLHGRAGDRAALRLGQSGLSAGDVLAELPHAIREIAER